MVDGTPLLDIKPYFPDIDAHPDALTGWMGDKLKTIGKGKRADNRFISKHSLINHNVQNTKKPEE
jgi:tRNA (Thr-GGU) A37 N-methylase